MTNVDDRKRKERCGRGRLRLAQQRLQGSSAGPSFYQCYMLTISLAMTPPIRHEQGLLSGSCQRAFAASERNVPVGGHGISGKPMRHSDE